MTIGQTPDFGVFLALWNTTQGYTTPDIHFSIATWLQTCWERGERRLLLMAFRASGKSTLAGLFSAWLLCRDPDTRILVLAAESSLSRKMVRNIRRIIERHPLTRHLRPKTPDQWSTDRFTVLRDRESRDPSVLARGITSNITGTRADVIICDDVEVPNTCDTPDKRRDLRERLEENEFILSAGGRILYIGTPHSYYTIYADAPRVEIGEERAFLQDYRGLCLPILDGQGCSAWPERYSEKDIDDMRRRTGPHKFAAQMMLQPVNAAEGRLDPSLLLRYHSDLEYSEAQKHIRLSLEGRRLVSCSAWWDPAFGGLTGDSSVLAVVFTDDEGDYWLHRLAYLKNDPDGGMDEATSQCRQVAALARDFYVPSIAIETNGIGKFLPAILRRELALMRVPCAVVEKYTTRPKDIRILESFDAVLAARALHAHASVYATPLMAELQEWSPGVSSRDDGLDAVAGALSLEPVRLRRAYHAGRIGWRGGSDTHAARTDFEF